MLVIFVPSQLTTLDLQDVTTLKMKSNPSLTEADKKEMLKEGLDKLFARWVCPITLAETNGKNK